MISVAKSNDIRCVDFYPQEFDKLSDMAKVITKNLWSPIIYKNNRRLGQNFEASMFVAIDMDKGNTLKNIHETLDDLGLMYLIGLTKNHQKWKNGEKPCDRYRLILVADRFCENPEDYRFTIISFINALKSDDSCKDLARCYYPCTEIYAVNDQGHTMQWLKKPPEKLRKPTEKKTVNQTKVLEYLSGKRLVKSGSRHMTLFTAICELRRLGLTDEQITDIVHDSKLGCELIAEDGEKEIFRYVRSSEKYR